MKIEQGGRGSPQIAYLDDMMWKPWGSHDFTRKNKILIRRLNMYGFKVYQGPWECIL